MDSTKSKRFAAFHSRDYRMLWFGQLISNIGTQMQLVALNWHIYLLTGSPIALGLIGLARVVPIIIFSLLGGAVADSVNRKKIIFSMQIIMGILSFFLAVVTYFDRATPILLYLFTALASVAMSFELPARQAFIPRLVPKENLANAMSMNSLMFQTSMIIGPTIAGFIIAGSGVGAVYAFNALSFMGVMIALLQIRTKGTIVGPKVDVNLDGIKEGISFVRSRTILWSTMLLDFFSRFFAAAIALLPIFAKEVLNVGPEGLGLLYAAPSIGAVIAAATIAQFSILRREGLVLLGAITLFAVGTIIFGLSKIFFISFLALILVGLGDSISAIIRNTIRQLSTPDSLRGRMTSINMIFFMGGPQLGGFWSGLLAGLIGAPLTVVLGGIGTLIVVSAVGIKLPTLRKFDQKAQSPL